MSAPGVSKECHASNVLKRARWTYGGMMDLLKKEFSWSSGPEDIRHLDDPTKHMLKVQMMVVKSAIESLEAFGEDVGQIQYLDRMVSHYDCGFREAVKHGKDEKVWGGNDAAYQLCNLNLHMVMDVMWYLGHAADGKPWKEMEHEEMSWRW